MAGSPWFQRNRNAICKESALVRVLEAPSGIVWRLVSSANTLRPLPASVTDAPGRIEELFADIHSWAKAEGAHLVVDHSAALSAEPMRWTADDLGTLFAGLSPRAFQSRDLARLLTGFLDAAAPDETERSAIGPHLASALRKAMLETLTLAPAEHIKTILAYVNSWTAVRAACIGRAPGATSRFRLCSKWCPAGSPGVARRPSSLPAAIKCRSQSAAARAPIAC